MSDRMIAATQVELWVALDVPNIDAAVDAVHDLRIANRPFGIKVGLELVTAEGLPKIMHVLRGTPVFIDLKLKDIPATVAGAARSLTRFKPAIFNVHASGGVRMMEAAIKECGDSAVFAVTVLTSMSDSEAGAIYGVSSANYAVDTFAKMAAESGCHGIICSPKDLDVVGTSLLRLCPGIRPSWASAKGDQTRVTTPAEAAVAGADGIVVGRPILSPPTGITRQRALRMVHDEFRLMTMLVANNGILNGHYVYKSGRHGPLYFNKSVLLDDDAMIYRVARMIIDSLPEHYRYDVVVGPETGGAKLAKRIGEIMGQPHEAASKTPDGFWIQRWCKDFKEVLVVEDVLTTGGSLAKVIIEVERLGGNATIKRALLNRGGVQMPGLATIAMHDAVSYDADKCPLCESGVPINTNVGHAIK